MGTKAIIRNEWMRRKVFWLIMFAIFLTWLFFVIKGNYYDQEQLKKYGVYTACKIMEYDKAGKSSKYTTYHYIVNGEVYEASIQKWLYSCTDKNHCVGAKFKIKYLPNNPNIHRLLLDKRLDDSIKLGTNISE